MHNFTEWLKSFRYYVNSSLSGTSTNHLFLKFTLICTFLKQFAFVDTKVLSSTVLLVNLDFISKVCVLVRQVHTFPKIDHCDNCIAVWCCFVNPPWVLGQTKWTPGDCMSCHGTPVPTRLYNVKNRDIEFQAPHKKIFIKGRCIQSVRIENVT